MAPLRTSASLTLLKDSEEKGNLCSQGCSTPNTPQPQPDTHTDITFLFCTHIHLHTPTQTLKLLYFFHTQLRYTYTYSSDLDLHIRCYIYSSMMLLLFSWLLFFYRVFTYVLTCSMCLWNAFRGQIKSFGIWIWIWNHWGHVITGFDTDGVAKERHWERIEGRYPLVGQLCSISHGIELQI